MAEERDDANPFQTSTNALSRRGDLVVPSSAMGMVIVLGNGKDTEQEAALKLVLLALHKARLATLVLHAIEWEPTHLAAQQTFVHRRVQQLLDTVDDLSRSGTPSRLPVGYLGRDAGSVAAMHAAAAQPEHVSAVVLLDGILDVAASDLLSRVTAPTLLISGSEQSLRRDASGSSLLCHLCCPHEQARVPGVHHPLQTERSAAESARLACAWFTRHFAVDAHAADRPQLVRQPTV
jgi:hypothetical protein